LWCLTRLAPPDDPQITLSSPVNGLKIREECPPYLPLMQTFRGLLRRAGLFRMSSGFTKLLILCYPCNPTSADGKNFEQRKTTRAWNMNSTEFFERILHAKLRTAYSYGATDQNNRIFLRVWDDQITPDKRKVRVGL